MRKIVIGKDCYNEVTLDILYNIYIKDTVYVRYYIIFYVYVYIIEKKM